MSECFVCTDCHEYYDSYEELKFYSYDSGGFCQRCNGESFHVLDKEEWELEIDG